MIHSQKSTIKENLLALPKDILLRLLKEVIRIYGSAYKELPENQNAILVAFEQEMDKFNLTLQRGLREFDQRFPGMQAQDLKSGESYEPFVVGQKVGKGAFDLYQSFGIPREEIKELLENRLYVFDEYEFEDEFKKHQNLSRTASAGTFKGGLADHSEKVIRLHTAHHLLLKALQIVLGPHVKQRGSNITGERLRMDFSHDAKMTDGQKAEVERIVNEKIAEDLPVIRSEMPLEEAEKLGAEHEFGQKYPARVSVYSVGPKTATQKDPQFAKAFSIEFCGGPHVANTGKIGKFKFGKEEASSAGVRRVRGTLE